MKRPRGHGVPAASRQFTVWLLRVTGRLLAVDRATTAKTLLAVNVTQVATVLVFFLPLKVVLLVGSEGVPRYFQLFVTDETRLQWIVALSIAIFALYALTRVLESATDRWTARGAQSLIGLAERVPVTSNESAVTETSFQRICETTAKLSFLVLAMGAGLMLYPALFLVVACLLVAELAFASWVAGDLRKLPIGRLDSWVRTDTGSFIDLLKSVNFLAVFGFLLATFLLTDGPNLLIAIASIMISRQVFSTGGAVVKNAQKLAKDRAQIEALLFTDTQLTEDEQAEERELRRSYTPANRKDRLVQLAARPDLLSVAGSDTDSAELERLAAVSRSTWVDSGHPRIAMFDVHVPYGTEGNVRAYRECVYTRKAGRGFERQDFLLRHLTADHARAIRTVCTYEEGPFIGRVVHVEGLLDAQRRTFKAGRDELVAHLARVEVPSGLSRAHVRVHPPLADRAYRSVLERVRPVVDEPWGNDAFQDLSEQLEPIIARIAQLPLTLVNHRVTPRNAMVDAEGRLRLMDWRSWSLEPAGAGFNPHRDDSLLLQRLAAAVRDRADATRSLRLADLLCAGLLTSMEDLVGKGRPKQALRLAHDTLPLLWLPDADILAALEDTMRETVSEDDDYDVRDAASSEGPDEP